MKVAAEGLSRTRIGKITIALRELIGFQEEPYFPIIEFIEWEMGQPERVSYARGDIPTYRNPEWQANTFAAELMAPRHLIKNLTVEEIMEKCGMSRQAATIQYNYCHN